MASSCSQKKEDFEYCEIDTTNIRTGDLLFRQGNGTESQTVMAFDNDKYSHVGIISRRNSQWYVVHSVPGESEEVDTVKIEPIREFSKGDRCLKIMTRRIKCNDEIAEKAALYALSKVGLTFDNNYDLSDTTMFYCTELVWQSYKNQGIDISYGRRHHINFLGFNGYYIFPSDLQ